MPLTPRQKRIGQLALAKGNDKDLLFLDILEEFNEHLEAIHELLEVIAGKEKLEVKATADFAKLVDLTETNALLEKLLKKENEPIEITLDIT